jgi:DNA repair exonuclease SbcCD ATPase subunit
MTDGPAHKKLAELEQKLAEAKRHERAVGSEAAAFDQRVDDLREDLTEAHAVGRGAKKVEAEIRAAKGRRRDHVPRLMGARRRRDRAEQAVNSHITAHFLELLDEAIPDCRDAAAELKRAIDWVKQCKANWENHAQRVEEWVKQPPGIRNNPRYAIPTLRLGELESVLAAVDGNVPLPVPTRLLDQSERIAELNQRIDAIGENYGPKLPADVAYEREQLQTELDYLEEAEKERRRLLGIEDEPVEVDAGEAQVA